MTNTTFELKPTSPYRLDLTVWTLRRRPDNVVDRWDGTTYRRVLPLPAGPVEVAVTQVTSLEAARLKVVIVGQHSRAAVRTAVTSALERLLGLRIDLTDFYKFSAQDRLLGPLALRFQGMKPPRFATIFEGVINAMACQQLTLTLGIRLLNRLAMAFGTGFGEHDDAVYAFPLPEELASLSITDLRHLGFSRQKSRAMIELARAVVEGHVDLEELETLPDDEAVSRLSELRGVGRWTAEYVLLRGLGRSHVFPGDDVGARNNLQRWLRLPKPLNYRGVRRAMSRWSDFAGFVYFHLLLNRLGEAGCLGETDPPGLQSKRVIKQDRKSDAEMGRKIRLGDCVRIPDGRLGRIREVSGRKYRVRVRRPKGTTHHFLIFAANQLKRVVCPEGWMSPEGYTRYLTTTLAKMRQRQARLGNPC